MRLVPECEPRFSTAYLHNAGAHEIAELRLGKKTEQLYSAAEKLHKQLDRYADGTRPAPPAC